MRLEDELWAVEQESHRLLDLWRDAEAAWAEEAARELACRYLDPHRSADGAMLQALAEQRSELQRAEGALGQADGLGLVAARQSTTVHEALEQARTETATAWRLHDLYLQFEGQARDRLPRVRECIERANQACG